MYEGVTLDDGVFCGPSCVFINVANPRAEVDRRLEFRPTRVGRGAIIGANATIVCGNTLGAWSFVAAGAVVTTDVPAHALVAEIPDVDADTFTADPASVAGALEQAGRDGLRPVGVIAVDLFGHPADHPSLADVVAGRGLWVMGDAAQSFGAAVEGRRVGTLARRGAVAATRPAAPTGSVAPSERRPEPRRRDNPGCPTGRAPASEVISQQYRLSVFLRSRVQAGRPSA